LIEGAQPTTAFVPAPRILVTHVATEASMGIFPMTKHQLARQIGRRWRGRCELLPVDPTSESRDTVQGRVTLRAW
jgi:hypothetical protein